MGLDSAIVALGWLLVGVCGVRTAGWVGSALASRARTYRESWALRRTVTDAMKRASKGERVVAALEPARQTVQRGLPMRIVHRAPACPSGSTVSFYLQSPDGQPLPTFQPGQFLSVRVADRQTGRMLTRCYSLSEMPKQEQDYYRITVKRLLRPATAPIGATDGIVSNVLHDGFDVGDSLDVLGPAGAFSLDPSSNRPIVFIGGGVGITPLMSMIQWLVMSGRRQSVWLFYGVQNRNEHIFYDELHQLSRMAGNFQAVTFYSRPTVSCRQGVDFDYAGRLQLDEFEPLLRSQRPQFYMCGPDQFMADVRARLMRIGVADSDVFTETFASAAARPTDHLSPMGQEAATQRHAANDSQFEVKFARAGKKARWLPHYGSLLEFAEASEVDARFGCRSGQCGTCKVGIKSGTVSYTAKPAVEVEKNKCLPCIARPTSNLVLDM
ncbi:MAG: 2Fe-2S iron-sulfur cluster-binding protein [Pseudomonadota bacterium]